MSIFDKKGTTVEEAQQWGKMEEKRNKRCKSKVNGPRKPKERGNKPEGPTWHEWQPIDP